MVLLLEADMARRIGWLLIDGLAFSLGAVLAGVAFVWTFDRR